MLDTKILKLNSFMARQKTTKLNLYRNDRYNHLWNNCSQDNEIHSFYKKLLTERSVWNFPKNFKEGAKNIHEAQKKQFTFHCLYFS